MTDSDNSPYENDGETVYATEPDNQGEITFGSQEEHDKPYKDKQWLFHQYVVAKKTQGEIADIADVHQKTISRWMDKHDIPARSTGEAHKLHVHGSSRPWEDENKLRELYIEEGYTTQEIGDYFDVAQPIIYRALAASNIETRPPKRDRYNTYPELENHEWLRGEYEAGRSVANIADEVGCGETTIRKELQLAGVSIRSVQEANALRRELENAVSQVKVPQPKEDGNSSTPDDSGYATMSSGNRSYSGPSSGIDMSWSDSSDVNREQWVPYRDEEWLRWQYWGLENSLREIGDLCSVSEPTILRHMKKLGIERRESGQRPATDDE